MKVCFAQDADGSMPTFPFKHLYSKMMAMVLKAISKAGGDKPLHKFSVCGLASGPLHAGAVEDAYGIKLLHNLSAEEIVDAHDSLLKHVTGELMSFDRDSYRKKGAEAHHPSLMESTHPQATDYLNLLTMAMVNNFLDDMHTKLRLHLDGDEQYTDHPGLEACRVDFKDSVSGCVLRIEFGDPPVSRPSQPMCVCSPN